MLNFAQQAHEAAANRAVTVDSGEHHQPARAESADARAHRHHFSEHRRVQPVFSHGMTEGQQGHRLFAGGAFVILT